ncbi:hypothetical protein MLD38_040525 [Melastoma candidum]|nr:hypothetical protein MLD38_040525 [Melastoma candidum]
MATANLQIRPSTCLPCSSSPTPLLPHGEPRARRQRHHLSSTLQAKALPASALPMLMGPTAALAGGVSPSHRTSRSNHVDRADSGQPPKRFPLFTSQLRFARPPRQFGEASSNGEAPIDHGEPMEALCIRLSMHGWVGGPER